jgi:hypothetical protein
MTKAKDKKHRAQQQVFDEYNEVKDKEYRASAPLYYLHVVCGNGTVIRRDKLYTLKSAIAYIGRLKKYFAREYIYEIYECRGDVYKLVETIK